MKIVNLMNFVRQIDERRENSTENLLSFTEKQLRIVNRYGMDHTFLLQYDALCDKNFTDLFKKEATEKTELGIWFEIVEPLTSACGIPYRSEMGWKWDWHIIPGYSMAYPPSQREQLIDEAMRKFKEVFGYYPKTVAGWLIDTHTLNHLAKNYDISAIAICRDQANTDAYTLRGGYFNQAYYPSSNNIFTPAQTKELRTSVPVFRLLGPCPIHNYDNHKYSSEEFSALRRKSACFTLEPCWYMGSHEETAKWMFDSYFGEESLGFAYAQIGQENSFYIWEEQVLQGMEMQLKLLIERGDVEFQKMGETGEIFKSKYPDKTPPTSVVAPNNFDTMDVQSVYYDCQNYTANLFRFEDKLFIRSLFLFDERVKDLYIERTCETFDAVYENLPIVDTMTCPATDRKQCGLMISTSATPFDAKKAADGVLSVTSKECAVTFYEDRIEIVADSLLWYKNGISADVSVDEGGLAFQYKGTCYRLDVKGAVISERDGNAQIKATSDKMILYPARITK